MLFYDFQIGNTSSGANDDTQTYFNSLSPIQIIQLLSIIMEKSSNP